MYGSLAGTSTPDFSCSISEEIPPYVVSHHGNADQLGLTHTIRTVVYVRCMDIAVAIEQLTSNMTLLILKTTCNQFPHRNNIYEDYDFTVPIVILQHFLKIRFGLYVFFEDKTITKDESNLTPMDGIQLFINDYDYRFYKSPSFFIPINTESPIISLNEDKGGLHKKEENAFRIQFCLFA